METDTKHKDITRVDQEIKKTHGYYVRVRFNGIVHAKFFADKKNGGRKYAKTLAIAWRNVMERRINKPRTDKTIVCVPNTNTGVVGVRLNKAKNRYEVTWVMANGNGGKTSVSINKRGKEAAFNIACDIRSSKELARLSL